MKKSLNKVKHAYDTLCREFLAVLWAVIFLRLYLEGSGFPAWTDQDAVGLVLAMTDKRGKLLQRQVCLSTPRFWNCLLCLDKAWSSRCVIPYAYSENRLVIARGWGPCSLKTIFAAWKYKLQSGPENLYCLPWDDSAIAIEPGCPAFYWCKVEPVKNNHSRETNLPLNRYVSPPLSSLPTLWQPELYASMSRLESWKNN